VGAFYPSVRETLMIEPKPRRTGSRIRAAFAGKTAGLGVPAGNGDAVAGGRDRVADAGDEKNA